jgi:hypothetical protein
LILSVFTNDFCVACIVCDVFNCDIHVVFVCVGDVFMCDIRFFVTAVLIVSMFMVVLAVVVSIHSSDRVLFGMVATVIINITGIIVVSRNIVFVMKIVFVSVDVNNRGTIAPTKLDIATCRVSTRKEMCSFDNLSRHWEGSPHSTIESLPCRQTHEIILTLNIPSRT